MPSGPVDILRDVVAILDSLGIRYVVGGSMASSVHGEVRFTRDADLIIDLPAGRVEALATALEPRFYVSRGTMHEALRERGSFNAIEPDSGFTVGFFVLGSGPFD